MKPILKPRADEEDVDYFPSSPKKEWSIGLKKTISTLVIFMAGIILGLSVSIHFMRYFNTHSDVFFPKMIYSPVCERECLSIDKFGKPTHLMHSMTDEQLFWRASMVPKKAEYPFVRVPKVAFMFMTRGPLPFSELWDRFFRGHEGLYSVYVHSLPDYKLNVSENSAFYGRQIPSEVWPVFVWY